MVPHYSVGACVGASVGASVGTPKPLIRRASGLERAQIPLVSLLPLTLSFFLASSFFLLAPSLLLSHARTWAPLPGAPGPENWTLGLESFFLFQLTIAPWADFSDFLGLLKSIIFHRRFRQATFPAFFDFILILASILAPFWHHFYYFSHAFFDSRFFMFFASIL